MNKRSKKKLRGSWIGKGLTMAATMVLMGSGQNAFAQSVAHLEDGKQGQTAMTSDAATMDELIYREFDALNADATIARLDEIKADHNLAEALQKVLDYATQQEQSEELEAALLPLVKDLDVESFETTLAAVMRQYYHTAFSEQATMSHEEVREKLISTDQVITTAAVGYCCWGPIPRPRRGDGGSFHRR